MAISRVESIGAGVSATAPVPSVVTVGGGGQTSPIAVEGVTEPSVQTQVGTSSPQPGEQVVAQEPVDKETNKEDLKFVSESMNHFMKLMNADLQFSVHEKTHRVMVKLVDVSTKEVLKEFPPEEFLDMVAKIQEYVGMLVDKKA